MAKILIDNEWFEEIAPTALYESQYESVLIQYSDMLYPRFFVSNFKKTVYSDHGSAKADLALVSKNYDEWWVVEVERADHSLSGHVIPQVRTLSRAAYGWSEADYLCEQDRRLNHESVRHMMKGAQPRVLVIVNKPRPDWEKPLAQYDAQVGVVEIFQSDKNKAVFRVNGSQPKGSAVTASYCSLDPIIPSFLKIHSPAVLPDRLGQFKIHHEGNITFWEKMETADMFYLIPAHANPLKPGLRYLLTRHDDGTLSIAPSER